MTDLTPDRLIALARELIDSWYDKRYRTDVVTASAGRSAAEYPMIHGLVAHTHRTVEAALLLTEQGMAAEAVPLVRTAYECAITAMWISQVDDAIEAVGKKDLRWRQALMKNAAAAGLDLDGAWEGSRDADIEALQTSAEAGAKNFEQRCKDLDQVGTSGYLLYRILSAYCHPTVVCAEQYLDKQASREDAPILGFSAQRGADTMELTLLVGSLVWAGRAIEHKEASKPERRSLLRRAAREAQVASELKLSASAYQRLWRAKREQKERDRAARRTRAAQKTTSSHASTSPAEASGAPVQT